MAVLFGLRDALRTYKTACQIFLLCIGWYVTSSVNGVVGKIVLSDFPYPMTVSLVQLLSISLYLVPVMKIWQVPLTFPTNIPLKYCFTMILPLAFGKFFSSVASHVSIWKVPVSFAHTVKATSPLFAVLLSRIILHEHQTMKVYISLVPIIGGVIIASLTELSFDLIGLIGALTSTVGFSLQNIFSKKCLKDTGMHQFRLLFIVSCLASICFTPLWIVYDLRRIIDDTSLAHSSHTPRLIALLVIDGFCNFAQNVVAFSVMALITPLSYAVASCSKRIAVITVSLIALQNPVSFFNFVGMMTAVFGVLLYNKAKYDQHRDKLRKPVLVFDDINHPSLLINGITSPASSRSSAYSLSGIDSDVVLSPKNGRFQDQSSYYRIA